MIKKHLEKCTTFCTVADYKPIYISQAEIENVTVMDISAFGHETHLL